MDFVELKRDFALIEKDQEINLGIGRIWGSRIGTWFNWPGLLEHRRVVLLAEASSGKTEEFRHQAEVLAARGMTAFFVRIEDLADDGFEAALEPSAIQTFEHWRNGGTAEEGWFFLDSVDEARLNHKSFEKALRRIARELGQGLERARVYVSCRMSDWKGQEDRAAFERLLPVWERPSLPALEDEDAALLDPIFKDHETGNAFAAKELQRKPDALLVVRLIPLNGEQQRVLAAAAGVERPDAFVEEIERNGLDALAERPGDLLDLADFWKTKGCFGSLAEMTRHGIACKLAERDNFRPDNMDLSPDKAHRGAERLAAALTLAKSFTLRAPGSDPDPTLAAGAVDPAIVLDDWTDAQRNALLRRGVFAPSTYGRLRFHHRSTQEYLMARWLDRLLQAGCSRAVVWELVFAERYGIETLVPSLHATAAWLALDHPDIREEIIRREPLVLLRHGDPRSLTLEVKEQLLLTYADRHAAGEISNDSLDRRAIWMFATPDLAGAIRQAWAINKREDFRTYLLRLIREGVIQSCVDLARSVVLDEAGDEYLRIVALQALDTCGDTEGLTAAAQWLKSKTDRVSSRIRSSYAEVLFPHHLTVDELLNFIGTIERFGSSVIECWKVCPDGEARERLLAGLADLCLTPPFKTDFRRISASHHELAEHLAPLAREAVLGLGDAEGSEGLVRLLMVVERAERYTPDQEAHSLRDLVSGNTRLQRRLFWADVEETRLNAHRGGDHPTRFWHVRLFGGPLWQLGLKDLAWLYEDLSGRPLDEDRRIALSAIVVILRDSGGLDAELPRLRALIAGENELESDLDAYIAPPVQDEEERRYHDEELQNRRAREQDKRLAKESWINFREELQVNPLVLRDPVLLGQWATGAFRLKYLSDWLARKTQKDFEEAALQWRLLEEGFGRAVAEAYRDGMKVLWRVTLPERPKQKKGDGVEVKYTTILSFAGLGIEAAEDPDWVLRLSPADAERAVQHACLSRRGYPDWIEALVNRHPTVALPVLRETLQDEWLGRHDDLAYFFSNYGRADRTIQSSVQEILFDVTMGKQPKTLNVLKHGLRVLQRLNLSKDQRRQAATLTLRRLRAASAADDNERMWHYLAMLFMVNTDAATRALIGWIDVAPPTSRASRAEVVLVALFGRSDQLAGDALAGASVASLEALVRIAYLYVRPEDDRIHDGGYTPDTRDTEQDARNSLLKALLDRPGADAYRAIRTLAAEEVFPVLILRMNELARGKAEYDADPPAWTPAEVLAFERCSVAPAKTGDALLHVVMGVLSDVQLSFDHADATSRALLQRANDESEVQNWLVEQMNLRSQGRFHAHREVQIARGDKPDVIVSSTAAQVEVAVEVKHGGMDWSVRDLEKALTRQLAEDYLKPETRRHGILVLSYHRQRTWRDPDTRSTLTFPDLINRLKTLASRVVSNKLGPIEVRTFGLNASLPGGCQG